MLAFLSMIGIGKDFILMMGLLLALIQVLLLLTFDPHHLCDAS
jgi:hypothetical protein